MPREHFSAAAKRTAAAGAVELMSIRVVYEHEIGHPDAEAHADRVVQIRAGLEGKA